MLERLGHERRGALLQFAVGQQDVQASSVGVDDDLVAVADQRNGSALGSFGDDVAWRMEFSRGCPGVSCRGREVSPIRNP